MAARRQRQLLAPGSRAPDFLLPLLAGGEAPLADLIRERAVLLAFFKVTCPICQMTFPYLERLHRAGLQVVGVSQNDPADTQEFNQEFGITFPTLLDTEESGFPVSNDYGISSVPTLFLVSPDGTITQVIEGWVRRDIQGLGSDLGVSLIQADERVPEMKPG